MKSLVGPFRFFLGAALLLAMVALTACGGGSDDGSNASANQVIDSLVTTPPTTSTPSTGGAPTGGEAPAAANAVVLSTNLQTGTELSPGGQVTVFASVASGSDPVADGTLVSFSSSGGSITATSTTTNGTAAATFESGSATGTITITASVGEVSSQTSITIASGLPASVITDSITPGTIGIKGAGIEDTAHLKFLVRNATGGPAPDGTEVSFAIRTPVNGGESLSATSALSAGGAVTVALQSGTVPGTVTVVASLLLENGSTITTEGRVTIVSNRPDAGRITMGAENLNLAGGVTLGLQTDIHAYLGDRAGNVVPDGTPVSFISECGTIGESGGFETTTNFGVASATLQTSSPNVPNLGGNVAPFGNPGLCRVVAFTPGLGSYVDSNGNGIFDDGLDSCTTTLDEPYIDANDSGSFEANEFYIDVDGNGQFDTDVVDCVSNSMIWTSMNVLISDYAAPLNLTPSSFNLSIGESQSFTVNFQDIYGNALVEGTTFSVTTTAGTISGGQGIVQADTTGTGRQISFLLSSDTEADAEPEMATLTATITPPESGPQGNNGAATFEIATGMINLPTDDGSSPSIVLDDSLPADSSIAQGGSTTITAIVRDADGEIVPDGTAVTFATTSGTLHPASATTTNGIATSNFVAGSSGGIATITVRALGTSSQLSIEVDNGEASSISLQEISQESIGVRGSGIGDLATIRFLVTDATGAPVPDGTQVDFSIDSFLGGGESLSAAFGGTDDGVASVTLQAGRVAGIATVTAGVTLPDASVVSTQARITIVAGLPDDRHLSLAAETLNIPDGMNFDGTEDVLTVHLGDRYSNPVPVNTPVYFASECGIIALTDSSGTPTNLTSRFAKATATFITANPRAADGRCTVIAFTEGEESFSDEDGNGIFDGLDTFSDRGEPFIDANENGIRDSGEFYVDTNANGSYTGPNGTWDADTLIWTSGVIVLSDVPAPLSALDFAPNAIAIADGGNQTFTLTVTDVNGNPLPAGTTVSFTSGSGTSLQGTSSFTLGDKTAGGPGITTFEVTLVDETAGAGAAPASLSVTVDDGINPAVTTSISGTTNN